MTRVYEYLAGTVAALGGLGLWSLGLWGLLIGGLVVGLLVSIALCRAAAHGDRVMGQAFRGRKS